MASVSSMARDSRGGLPARMRDTQSTFSGLVRRCQPPATGTTCTPVSRRRSRRSSRAAVSLAPSRSPSRRFSSFSPSGLSLANNRLSMMLERRPAGTASGADSVASPGGISGAGASGAVFSSGGPSAPVPPSHLDVGSSPTWVSSLSAPSKAGPSSRCRRSGLVGSSSDGSASGSGEAASVSGGATSSVTSGRAGSGAAASGDSALFFRLLILLLGRPRVRRHGAPGRLPRGLQRDAAGLRDVKRIPLRRLQHPHHLQLGQLQDGQQRGHHLVAQLGL